MLSSTVNFITRELSSIYRSSKQISVLKFYSDKLLNSKIPAMNSQLMNYQRHALDAIQQEIYEELMSETNWKAYDDKMADMFKHGDFKPLVAERLRLPVFKMNISLVDEKVVDDLINEKITSEEFQKYSNRLLDRLTDFEQAICDYKKHTKNMIRQYIPYLHQVYMRNVRNEASHDETFRLYVKKYIEQQFDIQ